MRLTLRTLLAYLDGLLESQQSDELAAKINDSEFATDLVYRTLTASRNPAVTSPKLDGRGVGADPNSVAQYLDNTLEESRIHEFERICLDSDMYLAEVKGCHSVLTVVLEKMADVNPELRNRIIGLPDHMASGDPVARSVSTMNQSDAIEPDDLPPASDEESPVNVLMEDPKNAEDIQRREQLVRPRMDKATSYMESVEASTTWKLFKSFSLVVIIALCVIRFNGPISHENALIGSLFKESVDGATVVAMNEDQGQEDSDTRQVGDVTVKLDENGQAVAVITSSDEVVPVDELEQLREQIADNKVVEDESPQDDEELKVPDDLGEPQLAGEGSPIGLAVEGAEPTEEPLPERVQVGEFLADEQITFVKPQDKNEWTRLVTASPLFSGDRIICVTGFNTEFLFNQNIHVRIVSSGEVELAVPDSEGLPQLVVHSGKVVISNQGQQQAIGLSLAGRTGLLELPETGSEMFIDTQRYFEPGLRINQKEVVPVVKMYGRKKGRWVDAIEGSESPAAPASGYGFYTLIGQQQIRYKIANRLPEWIGPDWMPHADQRVGETLGEVFALQAGPVLEVLHTQYESHRLLEVRGAMPTVLLQAGDPTAMVAALGNSEFRSRWEGYVQSLSEVILTGKDEASELVRILKSQYGDDAELIIRMLRGYTAIQLEGEEAIDLVENLEHSQMAVRAVAIYSLKRITGKTQLYYAEVDPARQSLKTRAWRDSLKAGEIKYKQLPSPEELLN
ncbi:MAG: hypothetical protein MK006_03015 [Pirellulales bacterium]|nr:hypothetical protein [Pirellulales bacterium]